MARHDTTANDPVDTVLAQIFGRDSYSFVALATGSLFVAATRRYYEDRLLCNRGVGYAVEVLGSAIGALLTLTLLLPMLGITWLLVVLELALVIAFAGAVITARNY